MAATNEENSRSARNGLIVIGIAVAGVLTVVTSGIALLPIGLGLLLFLVLRRRHRNSQPKYLAQQLIIKAKTADQARVVALLHEALDTDPVGKETLLACANWFYELCCWPDAADAYARYFHFEATPYYEIRHAQSLIGAGHLDEAAAELGHLRAQGLDESDQALVLSKLALTFALKGDPHQGLAFANEANLQKHALNLSAQGCLMMRGTCRYLTGQKAKAIEDIERLYAISSLAEVLELKTRMQNGTFQLEVPKAYPDWYPSKVEMREGPVVEEVPDGHSEELATGAVSPDGTWRWSGSQWEPITESETRPTWPAALSPDLAPRPESALTGRPSPLSADANWWWDGSVWKPTRSADGNWRWDGASWVEAKNS